MKNESKKANAKLTSVLAAVLIIVVAIVAVIAVKTKDSGSLGTYSCEIMSGDNSSTVLKLHLMKRIILIKRISVWETRQ